MFWGSKRLIIASLRILVQHVKELGPKHQLASSSTRSLRWSTPSLSLSLPQCPKTFHMQLYARGLCCKSCDLSAQFVRFLPALMFYFCSTSAAFTYFTCAYTYTSAYIHIFVAGQTLPLTLSLRPLLIQLAYLANAFIQFECLCAPASRDTAIR